MCACMIQWVPLDGLDELSSFAEPLFFETYPYVDRKEVVRFYREHLSPSRMRELSSQGLRYGYILSEGERAGFVGIETENGALDLSKIYISSGFRGRGIGSEVLDLIETIAMKEGCDRIVLFVNVLNTGAVRFYERHGFSPVSTEHDYGSKLMHMVKMLWIRCTFSMLAHSHRSSVSWKSPLLQTLSDPIFERIFSRMAYISSRVSDSVESSLL